MLCKANPPSSSENINSTARVFIFPFLMAMFSLMLKTIHTLCFISLCLSKKAPSIVCFLENFISFFVCYKSKILFTIKCKTNQCNKSGKYSPRVSFRTRQVTKQVTMTSTTWFFLCFKVRLSRLRKFLPNWNFPQPCSEKYHHLFVWCLKNKWIWLFIKGSRASFSTIFCMIF